MAGRFVGYAAAGIIAGVAGEHVSGRIIRVLDPFVYTLLGILFLLYGIGKIPAFLNPCTHRIHTGPFLLGLVTGIHPCPAFITLLYESMKFSGIFLTFGAFIVFFVGTSLFIVPLLIIPALSGDTYRTYMRRVGLMTAVLLGFFLYCSGISALFQEPALQPVPEETSAFVPAGDTALSGVEQCALKNGSVFTAFICLAGIAYGLGIRYARLMIGVISLAVIGVWLKITPGTGVFIDMLTHGFERSMVLYIIPLSMIAAAAAAGRIYCGYVCPVGIIAELAGRIGSQIRLSRKVHSVLLNFKYILLAAVVTLTAAGFRQVGQFEPFSLFASFSSFRAAPVVYTAVFFLAALAAGRVWCMYLCPAGAFLSLMSRNCLFPKRTICRGCPILRSTENMEGECTRCLRK
jgi:hypothetical protein